MNKSIHVLWVLLIFISCEEPSNQFSPRTVIYCLIEQNNEDNNNYELDIVDGTIDTVFVNSSEILQLTFFETNYPTYHSRLEIYKNKKDNILMYKIDDLLKLPYIEIDSLKCFKLKL